MKFLYAILAAFLPVVLFCEGVVALGVDSTLTTSDLSRQQQELVISNAKIMPLEHEPRKMAIQCFDVNDDAMVVIGTSNGEMKTIAVYDVDGQFQYGFTYSDSGSFGVQWNGDAISLYSVRGNVVLDVMPSGEIVNITQLENTIDNNAYWNHVIFAKERTVGNRKYVLRNHMGIFNVFAISYSQLIYIDSEGAEHVIYDVNTEQLTKTILILSGVVLFSAIVFITIYKKRLEEQGGKCCP